MGDHCVAALSLVRRSRDRNLYVPCPASATNDPPPAETPGCQSVHADEPGRWIWTSNANPAGARPDDHVSVNLVDVVPDAGATLIRILMALLLPVVGSSTLYVADAANVQTKTVPGTSDWEANKLRGELSLSVWEAVSA